LSAGVDIAKMVFFSLFSLQSTTISPINRSALLF
jgi:hypothetical protein